MLIVLSQHSMSCVCMLHMGVSQHLLRLQAHASSHYDMYVYLRMSTQCRRLVGLVLVGLKYKACLDAYNSHSCRILAPYGAPALVMALS